MLLDTSLRDLLDAFASSNPTPGGGSAAAAGSAIGVSLLMMVAGLPKTKSNTEDERVALGDARVALEKIRSGLAAAVDEDTAAYDAVVASYKLPKETDADKAARKEAIQRAMKGATDVPLRVMRLSAEGLRHARTVAAFAHRPAASDAGAAIALIRAGLEGASLNVGINIGSVADQDYVSRVREEAGRLQAEAGASAEAAASMLRA